MVHYITVRVSGQVLIHMSGLLGILRVMFDPLLHRVTQQDGVSSEQDPEIVVCTVFLCYHELGLKKNCLFPVTVPKKIG